MNLGAVNVFESSLTFSIKTVSRENYRIARSVLLLVGLSVPPIDISRMYLKYKYNLVKLCEILKMRCSCSVQTFRSLVSCVYDINKPIAYLSRSKAFTF